MSKKSLTINIILNGIRQVLTILFPLITVPYVSRHLGAEAYGIYNYSLSIVAYFSYIAAMGISTYAIREGALIKSSQDELNKLSSKLFSINMLFTAISFVLLFILLFIEDSLSSYSVYIIILSMSTLFTTLGVEWINQIFEDYLYITVRYIVFQIITIIALFVFVKTPEDIVSYCWVSVLSTIGANVLNMFHVRKYVNIRFTFDMDLKKHIKPLLVFFATSLAGLLYVNSDITMVGAILGDTSVGIYSFVSKIYIMIKTLVAVIISTCVPRITYLVRNDEVAYGEYMKKIYTLLALILVPIMIGTIVLSKELIYLLGGQEFMSGINVLYVLPIAIPFAIFGAYYSSFVLIVRNKEKITLIATIVAATVNMVLNFVLLPKYGIIGAAITTVIAELITYIFSAYHAKPFLKGKVKLDKVPLIYSALGSCYSIVGYIIVDNLITLENDMTCILRMGIVFIFTVLSYVILLFFSKNKSIQSLLNMILRMVKKKEE